MKSFSSVTHSSSWCASATNALMTWRVNQWCGLRPSVLRQDRSLSKKIGLRLGLAGLVLCCETRSCYARRHNDLEGHSNFSSRPTIYSFSVLRTSLLWRSTVAFIYLKVKWVMYFCLLPVVLVFVLLFLSWSSEFGIVYTTGVYPFLDTEEL